MARYWRWSALVRLGPHKVVYRFSDTEAWAAARTFTHRADELFSRNAMKEAITDGLAPALQIKTSRLTNLGSEVRILPGAPRVKKPSTNPKELDYQSLRSLPVVSIGGIRHEGYEQRF